MRAIDWVKRKLIETQVKRETGLQEKLTNAIDVTIRKKIKLLKKTGEEVTVDRLCRGWESLKILGVNEAMVRNRVEEILNGATKK